MKFLFLPWYYIRKKNSNLIITPTISIIPNSFKWTAECSLFYYNFGNFLLCTTIHLQKIHFSYYDSNAKIKLNLQPSDNWLETSNFKFVQKTKDLHFLILGGSGQILWHQYLMVIIFKIWQIIICSLKFWLNWAISSVFIFIYFSTNGGVVLPFLTLTIVLHLQDSRQSN